MDFLQISIFYKGFWLYQDFSTKLKEFYEKVKKEAELIKKQKRLNEIDQKFRDKGIK
ncbi:hypothetical protein [Spiroplasma endosymbiont of Polydrusus pterygomalis]|uniref:hypothetical protein n=1 Tax=Spiroplasma endosymbiont of Polydrusus pterygomalis TaxID=3139327 RepID=UPI003CCAA344